MNEEIIEIKRKFCHDCETWVMAAYKFNNEFGWHEWECMECGCYIEYYDE